MNSAVPSNFSQVGFRFLSTSWGQLVFGLASVLLLVMAKNMTRPSDERAFQRDDLAIGLDLLVLSLVTLVGYAISQYVAQKIAEAHHDSKIVNTAYTNQINAASLAFVIVIVMLGLVWMVQRMGRYTPDERQRRGLEDRFRPFRGLILPDSVGAAMLYIALKIAV